MGLAVNLLEDWNTVDGAALPPAMHSIPDPDICPNDLGTGATRQLDVHPVATSSGAILPDGERILSERANQILLVAAASGPRTRVRVHTLTSDLDGPAGLRSPRADVYWPAAPVGRAVGSCRWSRCR